MTGAAAEMHYNVCYSFLDCQSLNLLIPIVQIINIGKPGNQHFGSKIIWGSCDLFLQYWLFVNWEPAINVDKNNIDDFNKIER